MKYTRYKYIDNNERVAYLFCWKKENRWSGKIQFQGNTISMRNFENEENLKLAAELNFLYDHQQIEQGLELIICPDCQGYGTISNYNSENFTEYLCKSCNGSGLHLQD